MTASLLKKGMVITLESPEITELLSKTLDWLWLDMEHSTLSAKDIRNHLMVKSSSCLGMVRVPSIEAGIVKRVLDAGADGIIFPYVSTLEEAHQAVKIAWYPPLGHRGIGGGRAQGYGKSTAHYMQQLEHTLQVWLQIETLEGVALAETFAQIPGVTGLILGPYDLSASMGIVGEMNHPDLHAKIAHVLSVAQAHGKQAGMYCPTPESATLWASKGATWIAMGNDLSHMSFSVHHQWTGVNVS
ncbi:MAG: HpcH/HpaI aldolase family protein [Vampirovibrionales bacterium]